MKILHTSDWHLGSSLHNRKRYEEHELFLAWLAGCIRSHKIDVLLVAGDIFDTGTPGNRAQEQYYHFLHAVAEIPGLQVVVTGGNHDSPSLLDAPKPLLRHLDIHVIGSITGEIPDEVLLLRDREGRDSVIVCAVPYLRDRDIRLADPGESVEDKARKVREGIADHYRQVREAADQIRRESGDSIPVVCMGHLFIEGGQVSKDDGVRETSVGNLASVPADAIAKGFDYVALGHLHRPQGLACSVCCRYSGSPIPMGFGEAGQEKTVVIAEFSKDAIPVVKEVPVPAYRNLEKVAGDVAYVEEAIRELCRRGEPVWVEADLESVCNATAVQSMLHGIVENTPVEILKIYNKPLAEAALQGSDEGDELGDLTETEVFLRCLDMNHVPDEERADLNDAFREILIHLREEDIRAG